MIEYDFHDTANAFPYISGDAYETLKEDIRINGILEPVYLFEGKIIDGRNRYRVAKELGLDDIPTQEYEGDNPVGFVQSMNLHRRQLTPSQKAAAAAFLAEFKQGQHGDEEEYETQEAIAKKLGISRRMVVEATSLKKNADSKLIERVKTGDISLHNATAIARLNSEDQKSIVSEGAERVKEVAKKIKAMTKGKGRKKKDDPERIIGLDAIENYTLPKTKKSQSEIEMETIDMKNDDSLANEVTSVKVRKTRGKKISIDEANDFGHSLLDAIIVLGATAEDTNDGGNIIDTALSESQLASFSDDYDASELRALLSTGIRVLAKLVE
ncbi:ParB N-terminal domain-containing protein [Klebsiella sp. CN_Kp114]|uniref:ParB/RepB/Spo0J family partition protein n=1 Tax=unclassified Klebsiella TaxID=2608929 RepID=UPI0032B4810E